MCGGLAQSSSLSINFVPSQSFVPRPLHVVHGSLDGSARACVCVPYFRCLRRFLLRSTYPPTYLLGGGLLVAAFKVPCSERTFEVSYNQES